MSNTPTRQRFSYKHGEHIVILGAPGSGKTNFLYNLLKMFPRKTEWRAIAINTVGLFGYNRVCDITIYEVGKPTFLSDRDFEREFDVELPTLEYYLNLKDELDENGKIVKWAPRVIELNIESQLVRKLKHDERRLRNKTKTYYKMVMEAIAGMCMDRGNVCIFCDEAHLIAPNNDIGDDHLLMVQSGRNYNITYVYASQRFQDVDKPVTDNARHCIYFMTSKRMRHAVRDKLPSIDVTKHLEPFHWIWVDREDEDNAVPMKPVPLIYDDKEDNAARREMIRSLDRESVEGNESD